MQELDSHRSGMTAATADIRSTLQAGTDTANALHGTLETWDDITARMARDRAERTRAGEHVRRFDIRDYTEMLQELNQATQQLNALTRQLDSSVPALRTTTKELLNQLFLRLLLLVFACLLAALAYRALAARISGQ
jgi:septal ring factor EnvC (AmiA/AmiB activator)